MPYPNLLSVYLTRCWQIFELLDVDADGVINRKDFNAGLVLLG